ASASYLRVQATPRKTICDICVICGTFLPRRALRQEPRPSSIVIAAHHARSISSADNPSLTHAPHWTRESLPLILEASLVQSLRPLPVLSPSNDDVSRVRAGDAP